MTEPWLERVVEEEAELRKRYDNLGQFFHTEAFEKLDIDEKLLLRAQSMAMQKYLDILGKRLRKHGVW